MVNVGDAGLLVKHRLINRNQEKRLNVAEVSDFYGEENGSNKIIIGRNMSFLKFQLFRNHRKKCLLFLTELFLEYDKCILLFSCDLWSLCSGLRYSNTATGY